MGIDIGRVLIARYDEAMKDVVGVTVIGFRARMLKSLMQN